MYTRFHYNLKQWVEGLEKEIERASYLCTTFPDDPRYEETLSALNIYEKLRNLITGKDDCTPLVTDYDYMVKCWKESQALNKKSFQKIQKVEPNQPEVEQPVVIAQTQVSTAPELIGDIDTDILEQQLHQSNMEEIPNVPKKKKKIKTT